MKRRARGSHAGQDDDKECGKQSHDGPNTVHGRVLISFSDDVDGAAEQKHVVDVSDGIEEISDWPCIESYPGRRSPGESESARGSGGWLSRPGDVDQVEDIGNDARGGVIGDDVTSAVSVTIAGRRRGRDIDPVGLRHGPHRIAGWDIRPYLKHGSPAAAPVICIAAIVPVEMIAILVAKVLLGLAWRHASIIIVAILFRLTRRHATIVLLGLPRRRSSVTGRRIVAVLSRRTLRDQGCGDAQQDSLDESTVK